MWRPTEEHFNQILAAAGNSKLASSRKRSLPSAPSALRHLPVNSRDYLTENSLEPG